LGAAGGAEKPENGVHVVEREKGQKPTRNIMRRQRTTGASGAPHQMRWLKAGNDVQTEMGGRLFTLGRLY